MKRKLGEDDVPTAVDTKHTAKKVSDFNSLGLDSRLLQAVAKQNFSAPTLVQSRAIPLALEGKDILGIPMEVLSHRDSSTDLLLIARSKTGSGKTAAYILPILQSILQKIPVCDPALFQTLTQLILRLEQRHLQSYICSHPCAHP